MIIPNFLNNFRNYYSPIIYFLSLANKLGMQIKPYQMNFVLIKAFKIFGQKEIKWKINQIIQIMKKQTVDSVFLDNLTQKLVIDLQFNSCLILMKSTQKINQISIIYATQTGNSYQMAIQTFLAFPNLISEIVPLSQSIVFIPQNLYIFFVSTTGQGDPPYSMRGFWKNLMSKNYRQLDGMKFCIYGLGDRSYGDNFNIAARKLRQRLLMLNAQQIIDIGLGDQQARNGCFEQYFKSFFPAVKDYIQEHQIENVSIPLDFMKLRTKNSKNFKHQKYENFEILQQKLLSSMQGRDMYWVSLQNFAYQQKFIELKIGDVFQIYPQNSPELVEEMFKYFDNNNLNDLQLLEGQLKQYLKTTANLQNIVNFTFFTTRIQQWAQLWQFISAQTDQKIKQLFKDKLRELGEDYDEYFNYIKKFKRNIREVIIDFNLKIPLSSFMKRIGTIISRKYSISQINSIQKSQFSLLIKLQNYRISNNRIINGLCSHDLTLNNSNQKEQRKIRIGKILSNGEFYLDSSQTKNIKIAMISLGTGIAPFLTILGQVLNKNLNWQLNLFHSSRYLKQIPMEKELIQPLVFQKKLQLFLTYTRQTHQVQKRRIQIIIDENLKVIQSCKQGKIMICGVKQFCDIVCRIFQQKIGFDIKKLRKNKVICIQNW